VAIEGLLERDIARGDLACEPGVDRPGGLASVSGAVLDAGEPPGGFDRAGPDALALDPGDVDRGQDVPDAPDAGPEVRGRPGLVDELDGKFGLLDQAGADQTPAPASRAGPIRNR